MVNRRAIMLGHPGYFEPFLDSWTLIHTALTAYDHNAVYRILRDHLDMQVGMLRALQGGRTSGSGDIRRDAHERGQKRAVSSRRLGSSSCEGRRPGAGLRIVNAACKARREVQFFLTTL